MQQTKTRPRPFHSHIERARRHSTHDPGASIPRGTWRDEPDSEDASEMPPPSADHSTAALVSQALLGDAQAVGWLRRLATLPRPAIIGPLATTQAIICARAERGQPTDELTLLDELESGGHIDSDRPFRMYSPAIDAWPPCDADVYAEQIIQAAKSRHALREMPGIIQATYGNKPGELNASLSVLQLELAVYDEMLNAIAGGSRFRLLSLSDLRKHERAPLLDPETRLRLGQLMLIFARENVGKSAYVLLRLALLAVAGQHVVYICGEGLPGILARLEGIIRAHGLDADQIEEYLHIIPEPPQIAAPEQIDEVIEQAQSLDEPIAAVVLDTLATATAGQNENAPEVMSAAIGGMRRIMRALDCAGILVHHTGKDATRGARGHSSLGGAVDISVEVTREDDSDVIVLHSRKMRDDAPFAPIAYQLRPIALDEHADRTTVVAFPGADVPTPATVAPKRPASDRKMLDTLQTMQGGMRYGAWVDQAQRQHRMPEPTAKAAIRRLTDAGLVGKDTDGLYHVLPQEGA